MFIYFPIITKKSDSLVIIWYYKWWWSSLRLSLPFTYSNITQSLYFLFCVSLCNLGTGYGLHEYGFAPSFNSREIGSMSHSPNVPSNNSSNSISKFSSLCRRKRCKQLVSTFDGRSTFSYKHLKFWWLNLWALLYFWIHLSSTNCYLQPKLCQF